MRRILFLNTRFHSIYGAQANLLRLATLYGREQSVMGTTKEGRFQETCNLLDLDCQVVKTPEELITFGNQFSTFSAFRKVQAVFQLLWMNVRMLKVLKSKRIESVVCVDFVAFLFVFVAAKLTGRRTLVYVQGDWNPLPFRIVLGLFADRILIIADSIRPQFNKWWLGDKKVRLLYSGFPFLDLPDRESRRLELAERHGIDKDAKMIGLVGSITERKGGDILLESLALIPASEHKVVIVFFGDVSPGHDAYYQRLQGIIQRHNLEHRVRFAGFCGHEEVYSCIDVLVLPSRSEGLPSVMIEALGNGIPVVATDVSGAREIVCTPAHGVLVAPNSAEQLASAIMTVLKDSESQNREIRRTYAREKFSEQRYVGTFVEVLKELK
jgi:glycosyltransferase involved in cell wall biosynthesis